MGTKKPKRQLRGMAQEDISYNQPVLIRGGQCWLAEPAIANAISGKRPPWGGPEHYKKGEIVFATAVDSPIDLDVHQLVTLPLMDAVNINLPAGRLSEQAYQERLNLQFREAGID